MPQIQNREKPGNGGGLLGALLDLAVPNAAAATQNQANQMNAQTAMKPQLNPYQKGVEKGLKEAGYAHTVHAIQNDVPADHIVQEAGLNQNDPTQILTQLIAMSAGGQNQPQPTNPGAQAAPPVAAPPAQSQMTPMQQQAGNLVSPATTALGKLFEAAGFGTVTKGRQLDNIAKAQEIQGQKPLQAADYLKQATELSKNGSLSAEQLMSKFEAASDSYIQQRDAYARVQSLEGNPSPAGDVGLIFSYMKMLDPRSTVREGEQATAENARGVGDGIRNIYNRIVNGTKLTTEQRKDFFSKSRNIYKSVEAQQKRTTSEFARLGKRNGIAPDKFIRDVGLAEQAGAGKAQGDAKSGVQTIGRFQVRMK